MCSFVGHLYVAFAVSSLVFSWVIFSFSCKIFFFFGGCKFFKVTCSFFSWYSLKHTLYLYVFPLCVLKLGLSPGWPGTWSKQFDCFTSQNAEFTGTGHHAWLKNSFNLGKLHFFFFQCALRSHPNPNLQKLVSSLKNCIFLPLAYKPMLAFKIILCFVLFRQGFSV